MKKIVKKFKMRNGIVLNTIYAFFNVHYVKVCPFFIALNSDSFYLWNGLAYCH